MKIKAVTLYQFQELKSEELKQKIYEEHKYMAINLLDSDDLVWGHSNAGRMIADAGFLNPELYYELDYCQGAGACFDCSEFNFDLLLEDLDIPHKKWLIKIIQDYGHPKIYTPQASFAHHYNHENCRTFELDCNVLGYYDEEDKFHETRFKLHESLKLIEKHIEEKRKDLCLAVHKELRNSYEHLTSYEFISDFLTENKYYFNIATLKIEQPSDPDGVLEMTRHFNDGTVITYTPVRELILPADKTKELSLKMFHIYNAIRHIEELYGPKSKASRILKHEEVSAKDIQQYFLSLGLDIE